MASANQLRHPLRAAGLIVRHPVNLVAQGISGEPADQLAPSLAPDPAQVLMSGTARQDELADRLT